MSRLDLTADMADGLVNPLVLPLLMFEGDFDSGQLNMWSGTGTLVNDGKEYIGGGDLIGISQYQETQDLQAQGLVFLLNGVKQDSISIALQEDYQMRPCRLFLGLANSKYGAGQYIESAEGGDPIELAEGGGFIELAEQSGQARLIDEPYQLFSGLMDTMILEDDGRNASIRLSAENAMFILTKAKLHTYTAEDQKARYADDKGLDFVATLQDKQVIWQAKN